MNEYGACPTVINFVDKIIYLTYITPDLVRLRRNNDGPSQLIYQQRNSIHKLRKKGIQLAFLLRCRQNNILPKTLPTKKRLSTAIHDTQVYIRQEHNLLMRNFKEYGMSSVSVSYTHLRAHET